MAATVMAAAVGPQSPLNRNLERLLDEAQVSGELRITSRRLREFPKIACKYNLNDTVVADLSKNRLTELPAEVTNFTSLEKLTLYHNVIRSIPDSVLYLQCLTYLDISRNQLSVLPSNLCKLPLQVLLADHNRLVSLPEEINQMSSLIELDVSCNQLSRLPIQIGDLPLLQVLNLRKNCLIELPKESMFLKLVTLDISLNRISALPVELHYMDSLVELHVEHNPLTFPPAHLCTRGRVHIFKFLEIEAIKEDRKRGILEGGDCRRISRKPSTLPDGGRYASAGGAPDGGRRKRYTVDSGYQTTDSLPEFRWSANRDSSNGNTPTIPFPSGVSAECGEVAFGATNGNDEVNNKDAPEEEENDEEEKEERRRAARKIIEQQMGNQDAERYPAHIQTYREYKEALRQQRGNVYKVQQQQRPDNNGTPSPDTPPGPEPAGVRSTAGATTSYAHYAAAAAPPPAVLNPELPLRAPLARSESHHQELQRTPATALHPELARSPSGPPELIHRTLSGAGGFQSHHPTPAPSGSVYNHNHEAVRSAPELVRIVSGNIQHTEVVRKTSVAGAERPVHVMLAPEENGNSAVRSAPPSAASAFNNRTSSGGGGGGGGAFRNDVPPAATSTPTTSQVRSAVARLSRQNAPQYSAAAAGINGSAMMTPPPTTTNHGAIVAASGSFTVRREMEKQREEMEQIQQLRQCIESRLKVSLPDDIASALTDGVVLCHLANHVRPRSVASIHVPSPAVPKLSVAKCRRNVENFIEACRRIGVPEERLCTSSDVLERRNLVRVAINVSTLMAFHRSRPAV